MANIRLNFYLLVTLLLHILFINLHPVNLEELFLYAAENINKKNDLDFYFRYQANTLMYSIILNFLSKLFNFVDLNIISKLVSCSGFIFIALGINQLKRNTFLTTNHDLVFLIIITNPIIWNFGYRGTPDFISAAIGFCGLCYAIDKNKILEIFGFLILGLAIAIKPHSIIFLIFLFFYKIDFSKNLLQNFYKNYLNALIVFLIPFIFYSTNYILYDFIILNPILQNNHALQIKDIIPNLISYFGILTIFCFPFFIQLLFRDIINNKYLVFKTGIIYLALAIPAYLFFNFQGEIFLGFLSKLINKNLYLIILIFLSYISLFYLTKYSNAVSAFDKLIIISSLIFITFLSFSRASDRYVIFLIPLIIILFNHELKSKYFLFFVLIFNSLVSVIIFLNFYANSFLTSKIKNSLIENNIHYNTDLGNLFSHAPVFKKKYGNLDDVRFKLFLYKKDKSFYDECIKITFYKKCYSLVKLNDQ